MRGLSGGIGKKPLAADGAIGTGLQDAAVTTAATDCSHGSEKSKKKAPPGLVGP